MSVLNSSDTRIIGVYYQLSIITSYSLLLSIAPVMSQGVINKQTNKQIYVLRVANAKGKRKRKKESVCALVKWCYPYKKLLVTLEG